MERGEGGRERGKGGEGKEGSKGEAEQGGRGNVLVLSCLVERDLVCGFGVDIGGVFRWMGG